MPKDSLSLRSPIRALRFDGPVEEQVNLAELPGDCFDDPPSRDLDMQSIPTTPMDEDEANVTEVFGD